MQQAGQQLPGDPGQPVQAPLRGHQGPQFTSSPSQIPAVSFDNLLASPGTLVDLG